MAECLKCGRDGAFAPANHCPSCWAMRQESTKRAKERILGAVKRAGGNVGAAKRELGMR